MTISDQFDVGVTGQEFKKMKLKQVVVVAALVGTLGFGSVGLGSGLANATPMAPAPMGPGDNPGPWPPPGPGGSPRGGDWNRGGDWGHQGDRAATGATRATEQGGDWGHQGDRGGDWGHQGDRGGDWGHQGDWGEKVRGGPTTGTTGGTTATARRRGAGDRRRQPTGAADRPPGTACTRSTTGATTRPRSLITTSIPGASGCSASGFRWSGSARAKPVTGNGRPEGRPLSWLLCDWPQDPQEIDRGVAVDS